MNPADLDIELLGGRLAAQDQLLAILFTALCMAAPDARKTIADAIDAAAKAAPPGRLGQHQATILRQRAQAIRLSPLRV